MSPTGHKSTLPAHITQEFKLFYESLNNLQLSITSQTLITDYISASQMPLLPEDVSVLLDDHITPLELQQAIGHTKPRKAPGPNGLTIQYYKTLLPSLRKHMVGLFNDFGTGKSFHGTTLGDPKRRQGSRFIWELLAHIPTKHRSQVFKKNYSNQTAITPALLYSLGPGGLRPIQGSQRQHHQSPQPAPCC